MEIDLMDLYPKSKRPIDERGSQITEEHRRVARQFGKDFFDGERLFGYGGYSYHPRFWTDTVALIRDHYKLAPDASILDVGCAKGFMLTDFKKLMPEATLAGIDISEYAIENAHEDVKSNVQVADAKDLPFEDNSFDLVISITTIHNLALEDCKQSIREIQRVAKNHAFMTMDAYHSEAEREGMLKWNLTALTHMYNNQWEELFEEVGYTHDYYWFIAA
jgi:ubiquinone/menaquinone biosynthesis C-methylase UbiE